MSLASRCPQQPLSGLAGTVLPVNSSSLEPARQPPINSIRKAPRQVFLGKTRPDAAHFPAVGEDPQKEWPNAASFAVGDKRLRLPAHVCFISAPCSNTTTVRQRAQPWLPACEEVGRKKVNLGLKSQPVASQGCRRPSGGSVSALNLLLDLLAYVNCS